MPNDKIANIDESVLFRAKLSDLAISNNAEDKEVLVDWNRSQLNSKIKDNIDSEAVLLLDYMTAAAREGYSKWFDYVGEVDGKELYNFEDENALKAFLKIMLFRGFPKDKQDDVLNQVFPMLHQAGVDHVGSFALFPISLQLGPEVLADRPKIESVRTYTIIDNGFEIEEKATYVSKIDPDNIFFEATIKSSIILNRDNELVLNVYKTNNSEVTVFNSKLKDELVFLNAAYIDDAILTSNPDIYLHTKLHDFITKQISNLNDIKYTTKGRDDKIKLYENILSRLDNLKFDDKESFQKLIKECAIVSHHKRHSKWNRMMSIFKAHDNVPESWKAWKALSLELNMAAKTHPDIASKLDSEIKLVGDTLDSDASKRMIMMKVDDSKDDSDIEVKDYNTYRAITMGTYVKDSKSACIGGEVEEEEDESQLRRSR